MATPLYTFDYHGTTIETYSTYSVVGGKVSTNMLYYVKSGNLILVDNSIGPVASGVFAYYSNGNSYIGVLTTEGKIVSMGTVNLPAYLTGFRNEGIVSLASNILSDSNTFVVTYENGSTVGYNVTTGEEVFRTGDSGQTGIGEYLINYVKGVFSDIGENTYSSSRQSADQLIDQLEITGTTISDLADSGVLADSEALETYLEGGEINIDAEVAAHEGAGDGTAEVTTGSQDGELVYDQQTGTYVRASDAGHEYDTTVYDEPASEQDEGDPAEAWVIDTTKPATEQGDASESGKSTANGTNKNETTDKDGQNEEKTSTGQTKDEENGSQTKSDGKVGSPDGKINEEIPGEGENGTNIKVGVQDENENTALADGPGGGENFGTAEGMPEEGEGGAESIMNNGDQEEYVAVYNPETDSYDIYSVSELMADPDAAQSENSKLGGEQTDALAEMLSAAEDHTEGRGFNIYSAIIGVVLVLFIVAGFTLKRAHKETRYDDDDEIII